MLDTQNMQALQPLWGKLSLFERQVFITRECAQLTCDFCEARDHEGLDILFKHLNTLVDFADAMTAELEVEIKRDAITATFKAVQEAFASGNLSMALADTLDTLSADIRDYAINHITAEDCDKADNDAYENIKALMAADASSDKKTA